MMLVLDGTKIKSEADLHRFLKEGLQLGPYYGNNSAALWDRLTTDVERPVHLVWGNSAESRAALGEELFNKFVRLFQDVAEQDERFGWEERFTFVCK